MKIIDKFDKERLSTAERFSPRDYFEELIYKGRMITKLTTLGILALVEEPDKHAFPSYQKILENSTLGNWEQVLNRIANSPEIKLVKNNFNIREELTQKEKDSWQAQAVHKLMKAFREVDKNCQLNSEKTNLLEWFDKFVEFRNDTQGHGTPLPASLRSAMPPLEKSLDFISTEFSLFKIPWVVRLLGEDGAIIPLNDSGEEVSEESFFQYTEEKPKPEIFIVPNEPQKIYLLETDDDTMDFYFANGRLENNKFEVRSFLTNSFKKVSKPQEITEAEQKISENESEEKSSGSSFDIDSRLLKPFLPTEPYNFYREMDRFLKEIPISCDQLFYSPDVEKQFLYSDLFLSTDHWLAEYLNTQPQEINVLKFYSKNDLLCDLFPDNIWQAIKNYELEIAFLEKLGLKEISELISKDTFSLNEIGELELNKVEENLETSEFSKCVVTLLQSSCVIYGIEKEYIDMDFFIYWLVKDLSNEDGLILWLEYFSKFSIPTDDEIANETSVSETEVKTAVKKFQRETKEKSPLKSVSSQKTDLTAVNLPENSDYKDSIKVKKWLDVAENRLSMSKDEKKIIKLKYNLENNLPP